MPITYRPAVRRAGYSMTGFAGPSGSGKTLSALRYARGLVGGDDAQITLIDSENGRALAYAPAEGEKPGEFTFGFNYGELAPPHSPDAYADAIRDAVKAKPGVVIVDSMSHEHEGEGGILAWHERELSRMAGDNYENREKMKFAAWIKPKQAHTRLVNLILQCRTHFIFCFRAKAKIAPVKNSKGKVEFVPVGWTPICADRFEYEMTALLILPPNSKGTPDLAAERTKLYEQLAPVFPAGRQIDEATGRMMARWCAGKSVVKAPAPRPGASEATAPAANPATGETETPPEEPTRSGQDPTPATPSFHEDMHTMHKELRPALERAKNKHAWWQAHPQVIKMLQESAPALYEDLRQLAYPATGPGTLV